MHARWPYRLKLVLRRGKWGYGSPIGGVAAFDPDEGGVISPGINGFDLNCLHPDTKISCSTQYWKRVKDLEKDWYFHKINSVYLDNLEIKDTSALLFLKKLVNTNLYEITLESGRKIKVTPEHPLLTTEGMMPVQELRKDDFLCVYSFLGTEYEEPSDELIITKKQIERVLDNFIVSSKGNARSQILNKLNRLDLLDIKYNSKKLPTLLKIMGFVFGDGHISFVNNKNGIVGFNGSKEDLELIRNDIINLGFGCSNVYSRKRNHKIKTVYNTIEFEHEEHSISKGGTAFAVLLVALGVPYGVKTSQEYRIPRWILKAPLWQKRLFIAALFGAELSKPKTINKYNFNMPTLSMNKLETLKENAIDFLNDLRLILSEFKVSSSYPVIVEGYRYKGKRGDTIGIRIKIHGNPKNLIRLYENVGYEYNKIKLREACYAANYIRWKEHIKDYRKKIRKQAIILYTKGFSGYEIRNKLVSEYIGDRFIDHSIWSERGSPRIAYKFNSFEEYKKNYSIGESGVVKDKIKYIKRIPYNGFVYDFTMNDEDHNFIANSIISSNCGMRLATTNLTWKDVEPKSKQLVDILFKLVPAGVGVKGFVKINKPQFREVLEQGSKWCVENGYGWKEDTERTESYGRIDWADSSKVSDKATSRGINQLGTLGSGNHYVEVQVVKKENIHDEKLAKRFGIFPDQVVVMVHSGSRGQGHQIATDYMKIFEPLLAKYNIKIRDRELVCAPFNSKEGQDYYKAMACASNMAFANRQVILHRIREAFEKIFGQSAESMEMKLVYDVAHNIARFGEFKIDGKKKKLLVHRKGATQALGPGHPELAPLYKDIGQPVIIGGSMETGSYLLIGTNKAEEETFSTTCHGSGRTMSRTKAKHMIRGEHLQKDMEKRGIIVKSASMSGLAEEWGNAYKDINEVVKSVTIAEISKPVVGLVPKLNVKG